MTAGSLFFLSLMWGLSFAQESTSVQTTAGDENPPFANVETTIKDPLQLRDPFKSPQGQVIDQQLPTNTSSTGLRDGIYTNLPNLAEITLDNIQVKGIIYGPRAVANISTQGSMTSTPIREGEKIQQGTVTLKAILPRGLVFVEQITNVYGKPEYLETVISFQ